LDPQTIALEESQQCRLETREALARKYGHMLRSGVAMDPVILAQVDGRKAPLVIDGWHRVEGAKAVRVPIPALVFKLDASTYFQACLQANARHGDPLKKGDNERRIEAAHKDPELEGLSCRKLAEFLGGVSHVTIFRWKKKHGIAVERPDDMPEGGRTVDHEKARLYGTTLKAMPAVPFRPRRKTAPPRQVKIIQQLLGAAMSEGATPHEDLGQLAVTHKLGKAELDNLLVALWETSAWLLRQRVDRNLLNGTDGALEALEEARNSDF
jgi:hypothetical protein